MAFIELFCGPRLMCPALFYCPSAMVPETSGPRRWSSLWRRQPRSRGAERCCKPAGRRARGAMDSPNLWYTCMGRLRSSSVDDSAAGEHG